MTTGAPNTAVTALIESSVGANMLRAMRSHSRTEGRPAQAAPGQHHQRLCAAEQLLDQSGGTAIDPNEREDSGDPRRKRAP